MTTLKQITALFLALGIVLSFSFSHADLSEADQRILASADDGGEMDMDSDMGNDDPVEEIEKPMAKKEKKAKKKAIKKKRKMKRKAKKAKKKKHKEMDHE